MKKIALHFIALIVSTTISAQIMPAFWWQCKDGNASYNFHPAIICGGQQSLTFDSIPYCREYSIITVYHMLGESIENSVWQLQIDDSASRLLTTRNVTMGKTLVKYSNQNHEGPIIHTLEQAVAHTDVSRNRFELIIGPNSSTPSNIKVSELLFFDKKLGNVSLKRIQSYLAIKYGVTLEHTDYVDAHGNVVWNYRENEDYRHRIFGIGKDSVYGLSQTISRSECEGAVITIGSNNLTESQFCILGDNNEPLTFTKIGNSEVEVLQRQWTASVANPFNNNNTYYLTISTKDFPDIRGKLVVFVDDTPYYADSISEGNAFFSGISIPSGTSRITFALGEDLWFSKDDETEASSNTFQTVSSRIYPNPTTGHFRIDVEGASKVKVNIYSTLGVLVSSFEGKDEIFHSFEGTLPSGNLYYATVITEDGSMTLKLIVK